VRTLVSAASAPDCVVPSVGPIEYDSCSMPARRPRRLSGIVWFQIVARKMPDDMSAAPAAARNASASGSDPAKPKPAIAAPPSAALTATARPCRLTRAVQPLVSVTSNAPAGPAANRTPSTSAPPKRSATAGNSATGIVNSIALMSTRYVPMRSCRLRA